MPLPRALSNRTHLVMQSRARLLRGFSQLGRYHYSQAIRGLSEHHHKGAMEICYLVKGRQTYTVGDSSYRLKGGEVFVTFPDESHGTGGLPQEKGELYWLILKMPRNRESFLGLDGAEQQTFLRKLIQLPSRHFQGSWAMREHLDSFTRIFHEPADPLRSMRLMNALHAFLFEVIRCAKAPPRQKTEHSLAKVLDYIQANPSVQVSVPELARMMGLSEARFKVRFKEEVGVPPADYVMRQRIREAERLLSSGFGSITEIAHEMGFSSSQYFATVFKRYTHKTPSEFLRAAVT